MEIVTNYIKLSAFKHLAEIDQLIAPLKKFGISYFCYSECTADGALLGLLNKGDFAEFYLKNKYERFDIMAANHVISHTIPAGLFLWDAVELPPFQNFLTMARDFNMYHGCSFIQCEGKVKRSFNFATDKPENYYINNLYLNKFHLLQAFIQYFLEVGKPLIKRSNWVKIITPQKQLPPTTHLAPPWSRFTEEKFLQEIKTNTPKNELIIANQKISPREAQCLELIARGKSAKQIARYLDLRVRTIDAYIRNLKDKLHCHKQTELVAKMLLHNATNVPYK